MHTEVRAPDWLEFLITPLTAESWCKLRISKSGLPARLGHVLPGHRRGFNPSGGEKSHLDRGQRPAGVMVNWLSELNYRHVTERRLFGKFSIVRNRREVAFSRGPGRET